MILQNILKYRNGSNFAHTLLSTIKSSGANPPEKNFFLIMLILISYLFTQEGGAEVRGRGIHFVYKKFSYLAAHTDMGFFLTFPSEITML